MAPPPEPSNDSLTEPLERLLTDALALDAPGRGVWVALSGGLDSTLLLTLAAGVCARAGRPLRALHVNHGLQKAATDFEAHCRALCSALEVPLEVARVEVARTGEGLEGAARAARYQAFAATVPKGDTLWLAQHQGDQAETFLLASLRGSGVRGLAGMPYARHWQGRLIARPWLAVSREALQAAAQALALRWCDDPTNDDVSLDRNRLRHRVLPAIAKRWHTASLARSAALAGEADTLLIEYAREELLELERGPGCLDATALKARSPARQRLLVRTLCQMLALPTPPAKRLESLLAQLLAADDAQVRVEWPGAEARRWRGGLYLMAPLSSVADWQASWSGEPGIATPRGPLEIGLRPARGVTLRVRQGGEMIDVEKRGRRDLKRLLQETDLAPWQRARVIVVMEGERCLGALEPPRRVLFQARGVTLETSDQLQRQPR